MSSEENDPRSIHERIAALRQRMNAEGPDVVPPIPLPQVNEPAETSYSTVPPMPPAQEAVIENNGPRLLEPLPQSLAKPVRIDGDTAMPTPIKSVGATQPRGPKPIEVTYLTIDPANVPDAIDIDAPSSSPQKDNSPNRQRKFWWFIGAFALIGALAVVTQNGWLILLSVLCFFFLFLLGLAMFGQSRKLGSQILGLTLLITALLMYTEHRIRPPEKANRSDTGAYRRSMDQEGTDSYKCPHCDGMGIRYNEIKGDIGKCSSCGGDGNVSREQYDRLSK